jgi:phosphatidylserine/phosphatidylglycerophosphate/cardiolipin synthase-like enzyme
MVRYLGDGGTTMKILIAALAFLTLIQIPFSLSYFSEKPLIEPRDRAIGLAPPITVFFSPKGGCTEAIVQQIKSAKATIFVQAYSCTSDPISAALIEASKRGVTIKVVLDRSNQGSKFSIMPDLLSAKVEVLVDSKHAIAHNKIMIIDSNTVITGSFNFTKAAEESNAENLIVIKDNVLASKYYANWIAHSAHSDKQ